MTFHKCSIASPGFLMGKGIQRLSRLPASHDHLCNCVTVGGFAGQTSPRLSHFAWSCDLGATRKDRFR